MARRLCAAVTPVACALAALIGAQTASAQGPHWKVSVRPAPLYLPLEGEPLLAAHDQEPGHQIVGEGMIVATATNLGNAGTDGSKVTVTDQLPSVLTPVEVTAVTGNGIAGAKGQEVHLFCEPFKESKVECTFNKPVPSFEHLELRIAVTSTLKAAPSTEEEEPENTITVTGGGAQTRSFTQKLKFGADKEVSGQKVSRTPFGVERYEFEPENEQGEPETQAGSHPYQLTTTFGLNQDYGFAKEGSRKTVPLAPALQKNLSFRIPPGVLGNPDAVPQCSDFDFGTLLEGGTDLCPDNTAIGVATVSFFEPSNLGLKTWTAPVFNLVPSAGEPAKFGFEFARVPVVLDTALRTGKDYGVTVSVNETSQAVQVLGANVTLWGTPGDASHDASRGWNCIEGGRYVESFKPVPKCGSGEFPNPTPFLILPTSCEKPLLTETEGNAWSGETFFAKNEAPFSFSKNEPPFSQEEPLKLTGCESGELPFDPKLSVRPDTNAGSTPSGMTVEVSLPQQETTMNPASNGEADIKDTTLALPVGVEASAGAANGLGACGLEESGLLGGEEAPFAANFEQHFTAEKASCPDAAKIGTVEIETPLLPHKLEGALYLGTQNTDPFAPPLALYLIATEEEPIHEEWSKVLVKLAGKIEINPTTGQLVSTFKDTPQAPFEHLRIHLFGGSRASQATPPRCETYTAIAEFTPWPEHVAPVSAPGPFTIEHGCSGPGALPFSPSFRGGATNTQAGAFTPFEITLAHPDGDQQLTGLSMHLPEGAAAMIASVTPCPVALADVGQCPESSLIGHSTTSSGLGGSPLNLNGTAYLTESLGPNIPFGVSIKTVAARCTEPGQLSCTGPFNIGTIIANSAIQVDENTAAATITAVETRIIDPKGNLTIPPTPLPTMIKGVPVQLKQVIVKVDRPNFEFNPTTCAGHSVRGAAIGITDTLTGAEGTSVTQQTPYAVTGCSGLNFTPKLTATASGPGSKVNGTEFKVVVEAAPGQANIAKTFLQLPVLLPSRLSTIQQACVLAKFEAFPKGAHCDEGSNIGAATAKTPVLKKPFTGKAYLVSHGNTAFPDVEFVLKSEGIQIVLDGKTDIKGANGQPCGGKIACITYSRFETIPDAPVERFETVLPTGPHSALTSNVPESEHFNLCKHAAEMVMPTEITGQNGDIIRQTTKIGLTGCGGVLGNTTKHASKLQKCERAAKKKYAHNKKKRAAALKSCKKKYGPKHKTSKKKKKH